MKRFCGWAKPNLSLSVWDCSCLERLDDWECGSLTNWQYCSRIRLWSLSCPFLVTIWPKGIKTAQNTVYKSFPGLLFLLLNISFQHLGKLRLKDLLLLGFSWPVFVFSFTGQWLVPIRVGIVFGETFRIIGLDGMKSWWVLERIKLQHSHFCLTYTYSFVFCLLSLSGCFTMYT